MKATISLSLLAVCTTLLFSCGNNQDDGSAAKETESVPVQAGNVEAYASQSSYSFSCKEAKSSVLPDSVWKMTNLRMLSVMGMDCDTGSDSCWALSSIPPQIGNLKSLEMLSLKVNAIPALPAEIAQLTNLKALDLDDNVPLSNIDAVCGITHLQRLSLFGCGIKKLPADIGRLQDLKFIGLTGNPLTKNDIETLRKALPNCEIIFIH